MIDMFVRRMQEYEDTVQIDKGKLPLEFGQQDLHPLPKRPWCVLQSEGHVNNAK